MTVDPPVRRWPKGGFDFRIERRDIRLVIIGRIIGPRRERTRGEAEIDFGIIVRPALAVWRAVLAAGYAAIDRQRRVQTANITDIALDPQEQRIVTADLARGRQV